MKPPYGENCLERIIFILLVFCLEKITAVSQVQSIPRCLLFLLGDTRDDHHRKYAFSPFSPAGENKMLPYETVPLIFDRISQITMDECKYCAQNTMGNSIILLGTLNFYLFIMSDTIQQLNVPFDFVCEVNFLLPKPWKCSKRPFREGREGYGDKARPDNHQHELMSCKTTKSKHWCSKIVDWRFNT